MHSDKRILLACILNVTFSVFELVGSFFTGSTAILSDSVHDFGDAVALGASYFLERKSKKKPDKNYTYGYMRYSLLGGIISSIFLLLGSFFAIYQGIYRIFSAVEINYDGMILLSLIGVIVNFAAAYFTHGGKSLNQKAVNLHMLEDVAGWAVVLVGALLMKITYIRYIDPVMSILIAIFILVNAGKNLKSTIDIFLEKVPKDVDAEGLKKTLLLAEGVSDIHHLHIHSLDGIHHIATIHIVIKDGFKKETIRKIFSDYNVAHITIETEALGEECENHECKILNNKPTEHCHHHHHH